ncbi:M20 family metallopeptidase [Actinomadura sp. ATCC 31491]|uniref:M20 family metallopeptidase n=1 Tax=Actinomadura luzonensis TaxID=2805427 RepID=A0ABT0G454_9ACTN|nr:M20 family metallopeptidase [Actinomadura luzonensis]MCK2219340.1 M20 family metallopeptidase [Actinomadura luzonensis]
MTTQDETGQNGAADDASNRAGGGRGGVAGELHAWLGRHREEMLADLAAYVSLETPSNDRTLLDAALKWLDGWLAARLGPPAATRLVDGGTRGEAGGRGEPAVYGDVRLNDYAGLGEVPVLLLAHYDTVWPAGTLAAWPFTVDGDLATGPGVFDMKAGLVQLVWAVRALEAAGLPRPPLRLLLNGDEEIGSPLSRPLIEEAAESSAAVLVFEASADGALKTARKGVGIFQVAITGVEAHAGLEPAKGASAIDELARAVRHLHDLADPAAGTTLNVGVVRGGTGSNVVAGAAHAEVDVRVASQAEADRIAAALAALRPHDERAAIEVRGGWNRPVMERGPGTARLFALARDVAAGLGVELEECSVGGASDGNFAAALGLPVLDGLGAVGAGAHARHEHVSVRGMVERSALTAALLNALTGP